MVIGGARRVTDVIHGSTCCKGELVARAEEVEVPLMMMVVAHERQRRGGCLEK